MNLGGRFYEIEYLEKESTVRLCLFQLPQYGDMPEIRANDDQNSESAPSILRFIYSKVSSI